MSWMGALLGLGASLAVVGICLALGTLASKRDLYRDTMIGNYAVAAILVVIGAVIVGAVQG